MWKNVCLFGSVGVDLGCARYSAEYVGDGKRYANTPQYTTILTKVENKFGEIVVMVCVRDI